MSARWPPARVNADDLDDLVVGICHYTFVFYAQADLKLVFRFSRTA
jgi:hypothetical protein